MNKQEKQEYLKNYEEEKKKGVPFYPDIIFKDAVVSLIIFLVLLAFVVFLGAPLEDKANPSDTSYNPRPEWYFLFLFQLLKYFPGKLEFIGVVLLPTIAIILLFALPFSDTSKYRYFNKRKLFVYPTLAVGIGIIALTVFSIIEAPPNVADETADPIGNLYLENCAGCHGSTINISRGTNLHEVISQGSHAGMPPWGADLTNDQIDALAGFILSPLGSELFINNCSECHQSVDLVDTDPINLKEVIEGGANSEVHLRLVLPFESTPLTSEENSQLLNYLISPDGKRLFALSCSSCHGSYLSTNSSEEELTQTILTGGLHIEMPAWKEKLSEDALETLANYVMNPATYPAGVELFQENCSQCHFDLIPQSASLEDALNYITYGGIHESMPVWGDILTLEQIDSLVAFISSNSADSAVSQGRDLFSEYCAACHGEFGEGGVNPSNAGDIIAPISSSEYLTTRDDLTLFEIISQGQPNFGMAPFGFAYGGLLDNEEINALVTFIRSWEANPPVDLPPEFELSKVTLKGSEIYLSVCAQCHGQNAEGGTGPSLISTEFLNEYTPQEVFWIISEGHSETPMIAWGELLTPGQIIELVDLIIDLSKADSDSSDEITFTNDILPIFEENCQACHSESAPFGGWISTNYDDALNSGNNGPAVTPGDIDTSLLALRIQGYLSSVTVMPPSGVMDQTLVQLILDWISSGAQE